tara:strand:+ start:11264 stop:12187 length:924 start_codon:yes stop_codon:yes gene_type:complete
MIAIQKQRPGFIGFQEKEGKYQLDDLWFMVGSRCNLSCKHCYVASSPTNDTLQQITVEDIKPFLAEAKEFGVKHIYFTGGEPFINKDMLKMIETSLMYGDVTVLTNATFPITNFIPKLKELQNSSQNNLTFRVSLDHYDEKIHDSIRGNGSFSFTLKNVKQLHENGFKPIITSTAIVYENNELNEEQIAIKFKELFSKDGIDIDVKMLPYNLEMGTNLNRVKTPSKNVFISEDCMNRASVDNSNFQCFNGRTVQKIKGEMRVYPCPIIYNNPKFEISTNLKDSFSKIFLTHKACFDFCYKSGGKCTN